MNQIIRELVFETNSSTYHTITIRGKTDIRPENFEKNKDYIISANIDNFKKTVNSYSSSYNAVAQGSLEKAQMLLRILAPEIENQLDMMVEWDHNLSWENNQDRFFAKFYDVPVVQAFIQAIKKYVGENQQITIEFNDNAIPFISCVYDDSKDISTLLGFGSSKDMEDVEKLRERLYQIIFDEDIEIEDLCESNE